MRAAYFFKGEFHFNITMLLTSLSDASESRKSAIACYTELYSERLNIYFQKYLLIIEAQMQSDSRKIKEFIKSLERAILCVHNTKKRRTTFVCN